MFPRAVKTFFFKVMMGAAMLLAGCAGSSNLNHQAVTAAPPADQGPDPAYVETSAAEGSLWTEAGGELLFVDVKARRVGDTITIDIVENTTSKLDANTTANRNSSIEAGVSQAMGYVRWLEERLDNFNRNSDGDLNNTQFAAKMSNKFKGEGTSDRSGTVKASIGARVTQVLPNGNLVLNGRREMKVNNEVQYILVSGIVRPQDVDPYNRVKSTFVADARIEYYGVGVLADKQRPGWGTRVLDHVWPF
jgi:flagellar L-ring protein precursor FlgH